ncbi:hypothetical protein KUTeg_011781 [Tegillarca granosa]|uniref:Uncharacterized protein n=1 Tax=Tegillarca granosa TaxID=220873 RepID=A0ABQ9F033_TEGGR|nr:hypothetical protein KUTeg_011781 [Tegillarca granosa]
MAPVLLRVLNPYPTTTNIRQDAVIGYAEPFEIIATLIDAEDKTDKKDNPIITHTVQPNKARIVQERQLQYTKSSQTDQDDLKAVQKNERPSSKDMENKSPETRHYWMNWESLLMKNNILFRKFTKKDDRATKRQKSHYDMKATMSKLKIGEAVYYMGVYRKEGVCPKLQPVYTGPHLIIQKINELNYKIQLDVNGCEKVVHIDKLKLYKNENLPKWLLKKQKEVQRNENLNK